MMDVDVRELPIPAHFDPGRVDAVWRVPYQARAREARAWAERHGLRPAAEDSFRLCLLAVDVQNTFCIPGFELFVAGRSGTGAIDDDRRLCEFVYRNLGTVTQVLPSLDGIALALSTEGEQPDAVARRIRAASLAARRRSRAS